MTAKRFLSLFLSLSFISFHCISNVSRGGGRLVAGLTLPPPSGGRERGEKEGPHPKWRWGQEGVDPALEKRGSIPKCYMLKVMQNQLEL